MLSVLNFIEIRCILNVNVKYIMYLYISLIWFVWVYYLIMKIYKFWYWFFFLLNCLKEVFLLFLVKISFYVGEVCILDDVLE